MIKNDIMIICEIINLYRKGVIWKKIKLMNYLMDI